MNVPFIMSLSWLIMFTPSAVRGSSLVARRLGFWALSAWPWAQSLVRELRSCKKRRPKEITEQCWRLGFHLSMRNIPCRRKWQPTPVSLPEKPHGQRSLVGYSPEGPRELDATEWLSTHVCQLYLNRDSFSSIGYYTILSRVPWAIGSLLIVYYIHSTV